MKARGWLVAAALVLAGCKSEREKYLEGVESEWQRLTASEPAVDTERVRAYEAFLARFPEANPHGNPHAEEARRHMGEAQARLDAEAKRLQLVQNRRTQLLPLIADTLFSLAGGARDIGRDTHLIRMENRGVHQVGRGVVRTANWEVTSELPALSRLREVMGAALYDKRRRAYDPGLLRELLESAYLSPGTPLLGTTTEALFPVFRRRLRVELRLHRCLAELVAPRIPELEREFNAALKSRSTTRRWLEDTPPETDGWWESEHAWDRSWWDNPKDRRSFYAWVYYTRGPHNCGIAPGEVTSLDVGFWIRRFEDGTAPVLAEAIERVLKAYDGEWLKSLEIHPIWDKVAYLDDGRGVEYLGTRRRTDPARFEIVYRDWHGQPVGEDGEQETPEEQTVEEYGSLFFEEPTPSPEFRDEKTGDRLIRLAEPQPRKLFFSEDGKQLLAFSERQVEWLDVETLRSERSVSIPSAPSRVDHVVLSGDGRTFAVKFEEGMRPAGVRMQDAQTGETTRWLMQLRLDYVAVNADATLLAGFGPNRTLEAHFLGPEGSPERPVVQLPLESSQIALHPTRPWLVTGNSKLELWDLSTGEKLGTAEGNHLWERAFDAEGKRLFAVNEQYREGNYGREGVLSRLDPETRAFTVEKRFKGASEGHWLPKGRLLLRKGDVFRVVDGKTFQTVGRPVRARYFKAASPDGRWLLLDLEDDMLLWSLPAPAVEQGSAAEAGVQLEASDAGIRAEASAAGAQSEARDAGS
ncbi:hypothetical protein [Archangium lansingense]|uniref:Uncharacterized protein n=1 Tax=Archangium lansingense TaxID=2995310 RepID=A0ABT3ZXI4_9BACT|nr:hypothetical protein [Archangium lansinium]MCY1074110.1 hypothetical protein [Archangium lansinium]